VSAPVFPKQIADFPKKGGVAFEPSEGAWKLLRFNAERILFQYGAVAGAFDKNGKEIVGGPYGYSPYAESLVPGAGYCKNELRNLSAQNLNLPSVPNSQWFFVYAVGDLNRDQICELFVRDSTNKGLFAQETGEHVPENWSVFSLWWAPLVFLVLSLTVKRVLRPTIKTSTEPHVVLYRKLSFAIHLLIPLTIFSGVWVPAFLRYIRKGGCGELPTFYSTIFISLSGILLISVLYGLRTRQILKVRSD
jgi:hypothetical protein